MTMLDKVSYTSKLRSTNPSLKTFLSVGTLIICVCSRSLLISAIVFLSMSVLVTVKGGIPFLQYMKYMSIPLLFLLLSTIAIPFNFSETPLDYWSIPLWGKYLTISQKGIIMAINLTATAFSCVSCLYLLILTTPIMDLLGVLKKLHFPSMLIELLLLMYRFIFVLLDVGEAILTSQKCRLGHKNIKTSITSMGKMLSVLFMNAFQKTSYLYDAMESRCYDKEIPLLTKKVPIKKSEFLFTILFILILTILAVIYH